MRDSSRAPKWLHVIAGISVFILVLAGVAVTIIGGRTNGQPPESDVLLILVLPGEDGIVLPRTIDRYQFEDGAAQVRSLDPLSTVTIPGTGFDLLRDIYPFEGPTGLAEWVSAGSSLPSYVVLDAEDLGVLAAESELTVQIPIQMDVFDGEQMFTFPQGSMALDATQISAMLRGVEYLESADRLAITREMGREIAGALGASGLPHGEVETNLSLDEYQRWTSGLESAP